MAKTGYGKRHAGDEPPYAEADFAHLAPREAELAAFIDELPTGAAMGHKVIAAEHPRYGQQAVRTSMGRLTEAGHLRWIKEHLTVEDNSMRWVTRTYWSRLRRSEEWWAEFVRARHGRDVTHDHQPGLARADEAEPDLDPDPDPEPPPEPEGAAEEPSVAHRTLAQLRAADRRLALSEGDCAALEPLAVEWLARGATPAELTHALTAGLPPTVTNPGGLARSRLESKMPPKPPAKHRPAARARVTRAVFVCGLCEEPETAVPLVNGLCAECRAGCGLDEPGPPPGCVPATFLPASRQTLQAEGPVDVTERVEELRRAAGLRPRRGGA
ncbi:hypothetical protein ABT390_13030 [Streptomyces aurantiacus]|uniref:Uncharacterized protein n=1 Tax=Streptomyces aurantiacus JA 4570 TaxID=1286094 RepID=S3ZU59_9ACTN|nr:hypothetical protein [Streptomyces aurantiacus]EPH46314.1 hypothetical protein STRAU_0564 [Streptomyces aurantiacus JA 4570]